MLRKIVFVLLAVCSSAVLTAAEPQQEAPARRPVPFTVRDGLPNFYGKLKKGKSVRIGYFGGSITNQRGWRIMSRASLEKQFPKNRVTGFNASIGSTGSTLGTFRVKYDVTRHQPDLVFVEFATNDAGIDTLVIRKSMEGIVRQIYGELPECDICFVYTVSKWDIKSYLEGKVPPTVTAMEEVADYYRIPSVMFGYGVAGLAKQGKLLIDAKTGGGEDAADRETGSGGSEKITRLSHDGKIIFSPDGVHPYLNSGHVLYNEFLMNAMEQIAETSAEPRTREFSAPLQPGCWDDCVTIRFSDPALKLTGKNRRDRSKLIDSYGKFMPGLWKFEADSSIEFKFKGTKLMLFDLIGPFSADLIVEVDGKTKKLRLFDQNCASGRMFLTSIADDLPDEVHTVKITVSGEKFDKQNLLRPSLISSFDANPRPFDEYCLYAGAIFLIGELVRPENSTN